ncbi:MAG: FtsX-like permease family protein [Candidatus Brocadiia bacterium]
MQIRKPVFSRSYSLALIGALLLAAAPRAPAENTDAFHADCLALTADAHRLTGSPEYRRAADYVEQRLRASGMDEVVVEEFPAVRAVVKRCDMTLENSRRLDLLPMRANGLMLPVTPADGITGPIQYAGMGRLEDYGRAPAGAIVVLDYNAGAAWMDAFRMGAKAVVFVRNGPTTAPAAHSIENHADFPRFYYPGPASDLPDGAPATLRSEIVWESATGRNVFGFLKGTKPTFDLEKEECLILAANLDSFGEVPERSPGARGAANAAALIQMAEYLKAHRPRRHVLLAFFDGQAQGHAGSRAFYQALEPTDNEAGLVKREASWSEETKFLGELVEAAKSQDPFAPAAAGAELLLRLKEKAKWHASTLSIDLAEWRRSAALGTAAPAEVEALQSRITQAEAAKERWNALLRCLSRRTPVETVRTELTQVFKEVGDDVDARRAELAADRRTLDADRRLQELVGQRWISLHLSLMLGDTTPRCALIIGGESRFHAIQDNPGLYDRIQAAALAAARESNVQQFEISSADLSFPQTRALWAAPKLVHSGEVAGRMGIYDAVLGTVQEDLRLEGTPDDVPAALDLARIETQAQGMAPFVKSLADCKELSALRVIVPDYQFFPAKFESDHRSHGPLVMSRAPGSALADHPLNGAMVQVLADRRQQFSLLPRRAYAFNDFILLRTNRNGAFPFGPVRPQPSDLTIQSFAVSFDEHGQILQASTYYSGWETPYERLETFPATHGCLVVSQRAMATDPVSTRVEAQVMDARSDSPLDTEHAWTMTRDNSVAWFCEPKVRATKLFGLRSVVALSDKPVLYTNVAERSAEDLWQLDQGRMLTLQSRGVNHHALDELQGRSEDLFREAGSTEGVRVAEALRASSFMAGAPIYWEVRTALDDLVRAVLILLALAVPFAFALERLLIGATNIYRQILWFGLFFTATFLLLFFTHPAFAVSNSSIIIFLGFVVLVLSLVVITIIMRKFETELKALRGMTTTVHSADVSRFGTIMAAMSMGVSTMRRRPLRTVLTAVTILLLTFTILCFASFGTELGVIRLRLGPPTPYAGALLHGVNWEILDTHLLEVLRSRWPDAAVCPRYWLTRENDDEPEWTLTRSDGTRPAPLLGVMGLSPDEVRYRPDLAALLGKPSTSDAPRIWITRAMADQLGVKPGEQVLLGGKALEVGPLLDSAQLSIVQDMDESSIVPVDFRQPRSSPPPQTPEAMLAPLKESWSALPVDSTAIISAETSLTLGATLRAAHLYAPDAGRAALIADDLARMVPFPVNATREDGVYRLLLGPKLKASGAADLFFPLLLGGLVIFGAMLGSVADREKEIYSFSALGLAPPHVAGLFFAEAMVYSILGGLGGYLVAQGMVKALSFLAGFGIVRRPEMNYSSGNAVIAILIVMATVLLSALYPAIRASRSANPGILRAWRPPRPVGDRCDIVFPFTISDHDVEGVIGFLKEHFDNFGDTGLGVFIAKDTCVTLGKEGRLVLVSAVSLAPFDLGVAQHFELSYRPSEIPGIDEVALLLVRQSGEPKDWQRLNKLFLDDLRKQFLIWRSLAPETMDSYRRNAELRTQNAEAGNREGQELKDG